MAVSANHQLIQDLIGVFYGWGGASPPPYRTIESAKIPEPYHTLLVHDRDMTSTLEKYHGRKIQLQPDCTCENDGMLKRRVALLTHNPHRIVEVGAIRIAMRRFGPAAADLIRHAQMPLGAVLRECDVRYVSRPCVFFQIESDELLRRMLNLTALHHLYGRQNILSDSEGHSLAEVLEILPPMENADG